jgi:hypothetical protein
MPVESRPLTPRLCLLLAIAAVLLATTWALLTAPQPNSDRYDYLARAWNLAEGRGPTPLVVYPLRLHFPESTTLPATNITRPPLWPVVVSAPMAAGLRDTAGVMVAAMCLGALVLLLVRATPGGHGGVAALAMASSFATWRALLGGGPELALALLLLAVWTWSGAPRESTRVAVLGGLLGLMPWLHPVGWLYAALGLGSRIWRDRPRTLIAAAAIGLLIGLPWYVQAGRLTGQPLAPLQASAELARAVHDGGGLGPYRTLEPVSSIDVIREDPSGFLRHVAHNLKEQLRHLDGWLSWPLVLVGLVGIAHDRWLALRDVLLLGTGFVVVSTVAFDPRLLLPLVPIAALWVGTGSLRSSGSGRLRAVPPILPLLAALPWIVPLGLTPRPGTELSHIDRDLRDPSRATVLAYGSSGEAGTPCFTDSSVLAWRARRTGVAIPADPRVLDRILEIGSLEDRPVLIASEGPESWWFAEPAWSAWWAGRPSRPLAGTSAGLIVDVRPSPYVPEELSLGPADVPDSLVALQAPLAVREGLYVTAATRRALVRLAAAAGADGVQLRVASAYRSYDRQKALFDAARERHGSGQRWVAAPGTSEHQLGTTVDFCDAAMTQVTEPGFADTAEGRWLERNAERFGWVRSYTEENQEVTGYLPEPWHYRWGVLEAAED